MLDAHLITYGMLQTAAEEYDVNFDNFSCRFGKISLHLLSLITI